MGSDHDVYQDSSFGIPAIYLNDWPDRYNSYEFRYGGEYRSDEIEEGRRLLVRRAIFFGGDDCRGLAAASEGFAGFSS